MLERKEAPQSNIRADIKKEGRDLLLWGQAEKPRPTGRSDR